MKRLCVSGGAPAAVNIPLYSVNGFTAAEPLFLPGYCKKVTAPTLFVTT